MRLEGNVRSGWEAVIDQPCRIRFFKQKGKLRFEIRDNLDEETEIEQDNLEDSKLTLAKNPTK